MDTMGKRIQRMYHLSHQACGKLNDPLLLITGDNLQGMSGSVLGLELPESKSESLISYNN